MSAEFIEVGQTLDRNLFLNPKESHYPFFYLLENGSKFLHIDHKSRAISENLDSLDFFRYRKLLKILYDFYYPSGPKNKEKQTIKVNSYLPIDSSCMLKKRSIPTSVHTYIYKMHMQGCS